MKYSHWIGMGAALVLIVSCFLPWTYHPDLDKQFNGFFSQNNIYGKPGYTFVVLSVLAAVFFVIPKLWAKRTNIFLCAILLSYAIKSFIVFSGCYKGICPTKLAGLWVMLTAAAVTMAMTLFPDMPKIRKQ
jgi:hypothetical protein